ncbi:MAG TPA: DUF4870 domain-containing protein [Anaerolineales bacterium]|nr:DUF4870 domain-containing protein [Anaerolineales bacterium]
MTQQPMSNEITSDDKLWAALGYPIFLVALIMLFVEGKKDRPFIKFHAVQALILNVVIWVVAIVVGILGTILAAITLGIGGIVGCVIPILWLLLFWPAILAYQGKYFDVPVLTKFARDQHWVK